MTKINHFKYYKTSPEIIKLAIIYYVRYPLSLRQVEDILHERGIDICHETIRYWWNKLGPVLAKDMKKKTNFSGSNWKWDIDEVFVKIRGRQYYFWRAVDHEGTVLESYVSKKRDQYAARKVLKNLMKRYGVPKEITTDKCPSYGAALKDLGMKHVQNSTRYHNNQVENPHLHFRRRERGWNKFRSMRSLQKFASIHGSFLNHFNHQRHIESRVQFKSLRNASVASWQGIAVG
jgi:putative transposase